MIASDVHTAEHLYYIQCVYTSGANAVSLRGGRYEAVSPSYGSYEQINISQRGPFFGGGREVFLFKKVKKKRAP